MENKCLTEEQIAAYLDGLITAEEEHDILQHCKECPDCANELALMIRYYLTIDHETEAAGQIQNKPRLTVETSDIKTEDKEGNTDVNSLIIPIVLGNDLPYNALHISPHAPAMVAGADKNLFHPSDRNELHHDSNTTNEHIATHSNLTGNNMESINYQAPHQFGEEAKIDISSDVFQGYNDTCAIRSQQLILNDFLDIPVSQESLIDEASRNGWYQEGNGTPLEDVGKLLVSHGIPVQTMDNANIFNLTNELAQGHEVIVGVDSNELWHNGFWEHTKDAIEGNTPNHALIVAGIDTSDPNNVMVILKDPGTGDVAKPYPMDQFMDAWKDSDFHMVSTQIPAPKTVHGMSNFDYDNQHIPSIGELPYSDFYSMYTLSQQTDFDTDLDSHDLSDILAKAVKGEISFDTAMQSMDQILNNTHSFYPENPYGFNSDMHSHPEYDDVTGIHHPHPGTDDSHPDDHHFNPDVDNL